MARHSSSGSLLMAYFLVAKLGGLGKAMVSMAIANWVLRHFPTSSHIVERRGIVGMPLPGTMIGMLTHG